MHAHKQAPQALTDVSLHASSKHTPHARFLLPVVAVLEQGGEVATTDERETNGNHDMILPNARSLTIPCHRSRCHEPRGQRNQAQSHQHNECLKSHSKRCGECVERGEGREGSVIDWNAGKLDAASTTGMRTLYITHTLLNKQSRHGWGGGRRETAVSKKKKESQFIFD